MKISHSTVGWDDKYIIIPEGAKYVRFSFLSKQKATMQLNLSEKPLRYDEYKIAEIGIAIEKYTELDEMLTRNGLGESYMQEYMQNIAEEAYKYTAPNRHTFIFVADTHAQDISNRIMSSVAEMTKYVPCAYVAHGGDIFHGVTPKEKELRILTSLVRNANESLCPTYYVKGNHDWNLLYVKDNEAGEDEYILTAELANRTNYFHKDNINGDLTRMYFYVDDEVNKIRTIFINGFNKAETSGLNNNNQVFGKAQLEWLVNDAFNFSDKENRSEWGVITVAHQQPDERIWIIANAYKDGSKVNYSVTDGNETVNIPIDFTDQGSMEMIAMFVGDAHFDAVTKGGYNNTFPCIFILNASSANDYANASLGSSNALKPPDKVANTENETAFDIVTVDRTSRLIYLTRYGARSYVYNDETGAYDKIAARTRIVDYSTASHVVCEEE